jgi:hypothetical protein
MNTESTIHHDDVRDVLHKHPDAVCLKRNELKWQVMESTKDDAEVIGVAATAIFAWSDAASRIRSENRDLSLNAVWRDQDRAWPPSLDHFMGDPKQLCQCGHERQMHVRNNLEGRHRECQGSPAGCACRSFLSLEAVEAGKAVRVYLTKEEIYLDERQAEQVATAIESVMPCENAPNNPPP